MNDYIKVPKKVIWTAIWLASKLPNGNNLANYMRNWFEPVATEGVYNESKGPKLSPNYTEQYVDIPHKAKGFNPKYIILHHTSGGWGSLYHWLKDKAAKVSYHYAVNTNGNRRQFVWDSWVAWHAGRSSWKGLTGMNTYSYGLAWVGDTRRRTPTFEELDSMAELCIYLIKKQGWQKRELKEIIIRHQDVAPTRKTDCAPIWRTKLIERIKERLNN